MTHRPFGLADLLKRSRPECVLVVTLMISYAYFSQAGGWNQNSRFDLVRAIVEQGSTRIDAYADNTGDKALLNGHTFSDKAPGQALTAVPVAAIVDRGQLSPQQLALLAYAATVWASGIPTVVAALAAIAYGLASPRTARN